MPLTIYQYADALILTAYILSQSWLVLVFTIVLMRHRERKLPHYYLPTLGYARLGTGGNQKEPIRVKSLIRPLLVNESLPMHVPTAKVSTLEPDSAALPDVGTDMPGTDVELITTIHIEPDGEPTQDRQNIERIIRHLQEPRTTKAVS